MNNDTKESVSVDELKAINNFVGDFKAFVKGVFLFIKDMFQLVFEMLKIVVLISSPFVLIYVVSNSFSSAPPWAVILFVMMCFLAFNKK